MNSLSIQKEKIENLASFNSQFFAISENYKNGNYLKAEQLALISNNNFPNNEFILRILSDIYEKQNKKPEAINTYLQLIKVAPDDLASYTNLGILYLQIDKLKKAEKIFRKALEKNSYDFFLQFNLGITLVDLGKIQEAELRLKTANTIDSSHAVVHNKLGYVTNKLGKIKESETFYKKALDLEPNNYLILNSLGVVLKDLNKINEAEKYLQKAVKLKPNYYDTYDNLGALFKKLDNLKEARFYYSKSIELNPNNIISLNNLGCILRKQGDIDKAISCFIKAIELNPDLIEAWNNLYIPLKMKKSIENYNESYLNDIFQKIRNFKKNKFFSILKYKLYIGDIKSNLFFNKCIKSFNKKKCIKVAKSKLNNNIPKVKKPDFKNIVALLHFARSGTGLMHSLIDDHSEVSTLPSIYFSHFFDKSMWDKIITDGYENIIDNFISAYPVFFDARSSRPVADKKDYIENVGIKEGMTNLGNDKNEFLYIDKNLFKTELASLIKKYDSLDQMTFFKLVHLAYEKVINNYHKKDTIFYHIHNPRADVLFNFINHAPNSKWLVMVRDPVEGCEAWISQLFNENNYTDIVQRIVAVLLDVNNNLYKNRDVVGLRLEDLKSNPRYIIPLLCSWIGIKEEETLYRMTAQGKKWWGDKSSPEQEAFGKISKNKLGTVFNERDRFILETLFYPFRVKFNYVEENTKRFEKDLKLIRSMINEVFDFEKKIINQLKINTEEFKKSEMFLYFRSILIERWNILNQNQTYPNMLKKL